MTRRSPQVGPQELLSAIFLLHQERRAPTAIDLRQRLGVSEERLEDALLTLRLQGLVQEEHPRLTFLGLAVAVRLVPAEAWDEGVASSRVA